MAGQHKHHHLLIIEDDNGRKEFPLEKAVYAIGRDPKSDIRLHSQFVSRRHATLVRRQDDDGTPYYQIVDGNLKGKTSVNGLVINGRKLPTHNLEDEDEVIFGPQVSAKYYLLKSSDPNPTGPLDEFDITLISPGMMIGDPEELNSWE